MQAERKAPECFHTGDLFSQHPSYKNTSSITHKLFNVNNRVSLARPFLQLMQAFYKTPANTTTKTLRSFRHKPFTGIDLKNILEQGARNLHDLNIDGLILFS
jgi:hypothetical protein